LHGKKKPFPQADAALPSLFAPLPLSFGSFGGAEAQELQHKWGRNELEVIRTLFLST
jgi:hypothetical protein